MRTAMVAAGILALLGGCVGGNAGQQPAWFAERVEEDQTGYPSLREVPRTTIANTDAAHWTEAERQLMAAAAELRANPRSQPAPADDPAVFIEQARGEIEAARQAHEPN